jgi:hypothetical protein
LNWAFKLIPAKGPVFSDDLSPLPRSGDMEISPVHHVKSPLLGEETYALLWYYKVREGGDFL